MTVNPNQLGHIGVLMGGCSCEREISLKSGKAVFDALKNYGCHVSALDIASHREDAVLSLLRSPKIDVAFIALHGEFGEDGGIQSLLEKANIPYTGSGVSASRLAINKVLTQNTFKQNGIPVPEFEVFSKNSKINNAVFDRIKYFPVVVKPATQGSSIGITLVDNRKNLAAAIDKALEYDSEILIERYIEGKELTIGILGQTALPVVEIRPKNKFFDFTAKYQAGMTDYIIPAQISKEMTLKVQNAACEAHRVLGCRDFSRVDIVLDGEARFYVLEINTIPGFTATSLLPKAAKAAGIDFTELCLKLIALAYQRQKRPQASFA